MVVDIHKESDTPEQLHWHGQFLPADVDGVGEEGTPFIPAHGMRRIAFIPGPSGLRFYHTHLRAAANLHAGQYSGLVGPVYIEPANEAGAHDREVFLTLKEFEPFCMRVGEMAMDFLRPADTVPELKAQSDRAERDAGAKPKGYEVGYRVFTINGRILGHGEPVRVKAGERVLFHIVNGSAAEIRTLALPGHAFKVVALDGNPVPVPVPASVPVVWLGPAERVSALVEMNHPGVWVLGDLADKDRKAGMGIIVEYAGHKGKPQWVAPAHAHWDYTRFGKAGAVTAPAEIITMTFAMQRAAAQGFNLWTINGEAFDMEKMKPQFHLRLGRRYRLRLRNASNDTHPLHLHSFELTRFAGKATAGVMKDVIMLGPYQEAELDFTSDQPGLTLFHCHMQIHMDYGFMALFDCA